MGSKPQERLSAPLLALFGTHLAGVHLRVASWEIHPVYGIDVCKKKSLIRCKANDNSVWTDRNTWAEQNEGGDE